MHPELGEAVGGERRRDLERALRAVLLRVEPAPEERTPLRVSWRRDETGSGPRLVAAWVRAAPTRRRTTDRTS